MKCLRFQDRKMNHIVESAQLVKMPPAAHIVVSIALILYISLKIGQNKPQSIIKMRHANQVIQIDHHNNQCVQMVLLTG